MPLVCCMLRRGIVAFCLLEGHFAQPQEQRFLKVDIAFAGACHVYACEWSPAAVHALKHNLARNGMEARCTVLEGDCTAVAPQVCWPACHCNQT